MAGKESPRKRLFVGTFLPSDKQASLGELQEYEERLSAEWRCKVRLVHGQKMHLTWVFLGYRPESEIEEIETLLGEVAGRHKALKLRYTHGEFWPAPKYARLWTLTPDVVPEAVLSLAEDLQAVLQPFQNKPETRAYKPHITLARIEPQKKPKTVPPWLPLAKKLPIEHAIGSIDLIQSQPSRGAEAYQAIGSFPLRK